MEFLVRIETRLAEDMPAERCDQLMQAEIARARELIAAGLLRRIWRVPGRLANISLYEAPDATAVHEAISSLPLWPWMTVMVEALALHPLEAAQ